MYEVMYLTVREESVKYLSKKLQHYPCFAHGSSMCVQEEVFLLYKPPHLNITLLPCPPGFTLLGDPQVVTATLY